MPTPKRIAIWSGPRNISTALMRAWENRPDTIVHDEPLYAHYLAITGKNHPGRELTLARHPSDWQMAVAALTAEVPPWVRVVYQKQMAHHLLPSVGRDWLRDVWHGFLIRDPEAMLISLSKHLPEVTLTDTGLPQQVELFHWLREQQGRTPVVLDAEDFLLRPETYLRRLCELVGVEFDMRMLSWPPGPRDSDGAWGPFWYQEVYQTTCFQPPRAARPRATTLEERYADLLSSCQALYRELAQYKL